MTEGKVRDMTLGRAGMGKCFLSMWALLAKCSIYKILAVLLVMVLAEGVVFSMTLGGFCVNGELEAGISEGMEIGALYRVFENRGFYPIFVAASGFVYFILVWTQRRLENENGVALQRFRMSWKGFYIIKAVYNVLCLLLLFAVQVWAMFGMLWIFRWEAGMGQTGGQLYLYAFYGVRFLHCLLPVADVGKWLRNLLLVAALAMTAARQGQKKMAVFLFGLSISWFVSDMGINVIDILSGIVYACIILEGILYLAPKKKVWED